MDARWVVVLFGLAVVACGAEEEDEDECPATGAYAPTLPSSFVSAVDNPLWPLTPGTVTAFEGAGERIEVTVTAETRTIQGVTAVVVRDTVTAGGALVEDTYDWYAQDSDGNVWYLGEATEEYEGGRVVSTEGSWEWGVEGALPGIVMHARQPPPGEPYRQEYFACEAEDMAEVVATDQGVTVPFGSFTGCLVTREYTPLEPEVSEHKTYCPGVGLVLEEDLTTGESISLTSVTPP